MISGIAHALDCCFQSPYAPQTASVWRGKPSGLQRTRSCALTSSAQPLWSMLGITTTEASPSAWPASMQTVSGPEQLEALPFKPPTVLGLLGIMMISVFQVGPARALLLVTSAACVLGCVDMSITNTGMRCACCTDDRQASRHRPQGHRTLLLGSDWAVRCCQTHSLRGSQPLPTGLPQVIQFTITMFITMLIARGQRAVIDRDDNSKVVAFDSLLGLLLVMYPLVNMGAQMLLSGEIMLRRFMYYRLLSLQVRHAGRGAAVKAAGGCAASAEASIILFVLQSMPNGSTDRHVRSC